MELEKAVPLVIYDNECYVCTQFARFVNFLAKGRLRLVGHYTDFGKQIRDSTLDSSALEMFWFIDNKIAYGGMASTPKRAINCEKILINKNISEENIEKAKKILEKDFKPINDMRASKNYRMEIAKNLLMKCFIEIKDNKLVRLN